MTLATPDRAFGGHLEPGTEAYVPDQACGLSSFVADLLVGIVKDPTAPVNLIGMNGYNPGHA